MIDSNSNDWIIDSDNFAHTNIKTETLRNAMNQILKFVESEEKKGHLSPIDGKTMMSLQYLKRATEDDEYTIYYP